MSAVPRVHVERKLKGWARAAAVRERELSMEHAQNEQLREKQACPRISSLPRSLPSSSPLAPLVPPLPSGRASLGSRHGRCVLAAHNQDADVKYQRRFNLPESEFLFDGASPGHE